MARQQARLHLAHTFLVVLHRILLVQILEERTGGHLKIVHLGKLLLVNEVGRGAVVLAAVAVNLGLRAVQQALVAWREHVDFRPFARLFHIRRHVFKCIYLGASEFRIGNTLGK